MSPAGALLGTFLAIHVVIAAAAAGLLTAVLAALLAAGLLTALLTSTVFARPLTLLAGLTSLLALGLVSGLLRSFRLLGVVRHIDPPRMLKADVEAASTVEPAATG